MITNVNIHATVFGGGSSKVGTDRYISLLHRRLLDSLGAKFGDAEIEISLDPDYGKIAIEPDPALFAESNAISDDESEAEESEAEDLISEIWDVSREEALAEFGATASWEEIGAA